MRKIWTIGARELAAFFNSPVAYIVIVVYLLICGWFFSANLFFDQQASLRGFFSMAPLMFIFFAPSISMGLVAEEQKSGTAELLFTYPVTSFAVLAGKYAAACLLMSLAVLLTFPYALTILALGQPDLGALATGYLGLLLMGALYLAIGLWASTMVNSQLSAFILSFLVSFCFFILDKFIVWMPPAIARMAGFLSVDNHFKALSRGVIDSRDLIYYLSVVMFFFAWSLYLVQRRKWRG
ncbi:MAG: ABC transporter permease [Deltaproteobacteria bacterium]|nr:ABC transporter permease [Candidatus Anaeroferrophillus wilburensis]MBN2888397.1 ABC transporter permease [Deltaproteobacteria bacterium]